eukprot:614490-Rhodomonas_salina.1
MQLPVLTYQSTGMAYAATICYAMPSTELVHAAAKCYAIPSTELVYADAKCYAKPDTDLVYGAKMCYAKPGTNLAYGATKCFAKPGTEMVHGTTRFHASGTGATRLYNDMRCICAVGLAGGDAKEVLGLQVTWPICLRVCYAMSGTELAYGAANLPTRMLRDVRY